MEARAAAHPRMYGVLPQTVGNGFVQIPTAGESEAFPFTKGGWQGGVRTPEEFNRMMRSAMRAPVAKWKAEGKGFRFREKVYVAGEGEEGDEEDGKDKEEPTEDAEKKSETTEHSERKEKEQERQRQMAT